MKYILTFLFLYLLTLTHAQVESFIKADIPKEIQERIPADIWGMLPDSIVYMHVRDAARVEYWAQKGVASVNLIAALERELANMGYDVDFTEKLLANCQEYKEEYRKKVEHISIMYNNKATDYVKLEVENESWKKKAKNRGVALWSVGGAALTLLFGIALGI